MNVGQVMTSNPQHLSPSASMLDAAYLMKSMDVGCVPVVSDGRLLGLVTDRDIVVRGLAGDLGLDAQLVEIMSKDLLSVEPDEDVVEVFALMEKEQIRRLPVVDGEGNLVGIVSLGDLATRTQDLAKVGEALEEISEPEP